MSLIRGQDVSAAYKAGKTLQCGNAKCRKFITELDISLMNADEDWRCSQPECGWEGFIARSPIKRSERAAASLYGPEVGASFTMVPNILLAHSGTLELRATDVVLLLQLLSYRRRPNVSVWPKVRTLCDRTGFDEATVRNGLRKLAARSLIEVEPRYKDDGGRTSNGYRLTGLIQSLTQIEFNVAAGIDPSTGLEIKPGKKAASNTKLKEASQRRRTRKSTGRPPAKAEEGAPGESQGPRLQVVRGHEVEVVEADDLNQILSTAKKARVSRAICQERGIGG